MVKSPIYCDSQINNKMQNNPLYDDLIDDILAFFENPPDAVTSAQASVKAAMAMKETADILGENIYTQNSFFEFDTIGVYVVDLLVTNLDNGCDNSVQQTVEVLPLPLVDFSTDEVCFGEKTNFTNLSENSVIDSIWSFGDGYQSSFDMNPTCQFSSSGVFNSTLVVQSSNGCPNVIIEINRVVPIPPTKDKISLST